MKLELEPVVAPAELEDELEAELARWWWETLFRPLLDLFGEPRDNAAKYEEGKHPRGGGGKWSNKGGGEPSKPTLTPAEIAKDAETRKRLESEHPDWSPEDVERNVIWAATGFEGDPTPSERPKPRSVKVYHGSNVDFEEFDEKKIGEHDEGWLGRGFYFSTDKNVAAPYAFKKSATLELANPLTVEAVDWKTDKRSIIRKALGLPKDASAAEVTAAAKARGHDSVVLDYSKSGYHHQEIVAFDKKQIGGLRKIGAASAEEKLADELNERRWYHGTGGTFSGPLKPSKLGAVGPAIYLARDPENASEYAFRLSLPPQAPNVRPVILELEKTFKISELNKASEEFFKHFDPSGKLEDEEVVAIARKQGYDSVYSERERELAVFDPEKIKSAITRQNALPDWFPFPSHVGSLGMARQDLPQIRSEDRDALVSFLETRGIKSHRETSRPDAYRPTQGGYSTVNLHLARVRQGPDRPILVSHDRRILDGHHQWFKSLLDTPLERIDAIVFDAPIRRLLREAARFPGAERANAVPDSDRLVAAVKSGRVSYADGVFSGSFSAPVSRALRALGARFDKGAKVYRVDPKTLPYGLRGALGEARARAKRLHEEIRDLAASIGEKVSSFPTLGIELERFARALVGSLESSFRASLAAAARSQPALEVVTAPPDFSPTMIADVRETLSENLALSVKTFTDGEVLKLRELAEANWMEGGRVDRLRELIEERFAVTRRKAKFLAVQETSMVASEFARARAQEIGSSEYVWHCRQDNRVRPDHLELDGTTQSWDDPPIVDQAHDRRANPGMDYNCRCVARPILNFAARRVA
jgi:SPP1 gp7 family putative phage head morphogenesis protein